MSKTKEDLIRLLNRPVAFHRGFVFFGGVTGALLLSQLIYWTGRERSGDGWIFKTQADLEEETGLGRREQESARRKLKAVGVLKEKRVGLNPTVHFKVDFEALAGLLFPSTDGGKRHHVMAESAIRECTKAPSGDGGKRHHLYTETTAESTFSSSTAGAAAERKTPRKKEKSGQQGPTHVAGIECWTDPDLAVARQLVKQHGLEKVATAAAGCPRPLPTAVRKALAQAAPFDPYEFMRRHTSGAMGAVIDGEGERMDE